MAIITTTIQYEEGDKVKLPFNETGTLVKFHERLWASYWDVKIRVSNGFNNVGDIVDFFERDLELEKYNYICREYKKKQV